MQKNSCDIILFALFRWDSPYSSISIAMAKEFAKSHRIFYVNHPYSIKDYFTELADAPERKNDLRRAKIRYEKDEQMPDRFISVIPHLALSINALPKGPIYNLAARYNNLLISQAIKEVIQDNDIKQYIFINCYNPLFIPNFPKSLPPLLNIYQSVDDISQSEYMARHGSYLEEKAIAQADVTLVTSKELYRLKSAFTQAIHILNNAADISNFKQALDIDFPRPKALATIRGKIIGYVGNLDELRVNYPLLKKMALAHSDKTLVLVGPINTTIYKEIGLDQLPNVIFTGGMPIEELPPYLRFFDCAIIPFHCNTLTKSIYPLKINEYLAAGKAVVSSNFSPDIESFKQYIQLAENEDQFVEMVGQAVLKNSADQISARVEAAKTNTWRARIEQFWVIMNPYLPNTVVPQYHRPVAPKGRPVEKKLKPEISETTD